MLRYGILFLYALRHSNLLRLLIIAAASGAGVLYFKSHPPQSTTPQLAMPNLSTPQRSSESPYPSFSGGIGNVGGIGPVGDGGSGGGMGSREGFSRGMGNNQRIR